MSGMCDTVFDTQTWHQASGTCLWLKMRLLPLCSGLRLHCLFRLVSSADPVGFRILQRSCDFPGNCSRSTVKKKKKGKKHWGFRRDFFFLRETAMVNEHRVWCLSPSRSVSESLLVVRLPDNFFLRFGSSLITSSCGLNPQHSLTPTQNRKCVRAGRHAAHTR